jgi:hypothetical protein
MACFDMRQRPFPREGASSIISPLTIARLKTFAPVGLVCSLRPASILRNGVKNGPKAGAVEHVPKNEGHLQGVCKWPKGVQQAGVQSRGPSVTADRVRNCCGLAVNPGQPFRTLTRMGEPAVSCGGQLVCAVISWPSLPRVWSGRPSFKASPVPKFFDPAVPEPFL